MNKNTILRVIEESFSYEISQTQFKSMRPQVSLWEDPITNSLHVQLLLTESCLAYNFNISFEYLYERDTELLLHMFKSHIFNFIQQISNKIRSDNYNSNCTKELILEKYFDSYMYSKTARKDINYFEYVINNPNIILRRGAGHTRALVDFITEPTYRNIAIDTIAIFNSNIKKNEFLSYGLRYFPVINLNNSIDNLRGFSSKFFIFNSFTDCCSVLGNRELYNLYSNNNHFIILGE